MKIFNRNKRLKGFGIYDALFAFKVSSSEEMKQVEELWHRFAAKRTCYDKLWDKTETWIVLFPDGRQRGWSSSVTILDWYPSRESVEKQGIKIDTFEVG